MWPETDLNAQFKLSDLAMNIVKNYPDMGKIEQIKMLRRVTDIGLREAKDAIEAAISDLEYTRRANYYSKVSSLLAALDVKKYGPDSELDWAIENLERQITRVTSHSSM